MGVFNEASVYLLEFSLDMTHFIISLETTFSLLKFGYSQASNSL